MPIKTREELLLEIEELKSQLGQADETINAIRTGQVDAIIVSGESGEKIFSLASSETPYRIIIEEMDEGAVTITKEGIILYSNQRFSEIISTDPFRIAGSDFSYFIDDGFRKEFRRMLQASSGHKTRGVVSSTIKGETRYLQLSLVTLPSNMEGDTCIIVSDITEIYKYQNYLQEMVEERSYELKEANRQLTDDIEKLRIAEELIKNSERRYRTLFESANDGILIIDTNGRIVDINPSLLRSVGYSHDELSGKVVWEIECFRVIIPSTDAFTDFLITEDFHFEDILLPVRNGEFLSAEVIINTVLLDNKKVIQCNIRDISERKLAEKEILERENQLRELNATKDKFFSIITHDLKSPFTSIIGFSELLADKILRKDYDETLEFANIIHESSWRVMDLLTNLVEWSRIQTGRMEFNPERTDIITIIKEVAGLTRDSAWQKSISVLLDMPDKINIFADKAMISTVLRNLLSNAVKFTREGGEIIVSAFRKADEIVVSVSDNGIGIKKDTLERLFKIGETTSTPGTQGESGTGLGLLLCNEFIQKHGGVLWAESVPGKGSRFNFTLPLE